MRLVKTRATSLSKDSTEKLMAEVLAAEKADAKFFKGMSAWRDLYVGKHWEDQKDVVNEAKLVVNLVYSYVRSVLPTVFFQDPYVECLPRTPAQAGKEEIWESVINNNLYYTRYKKDTKKCVLSALLLSEGWKKIVYSKIADDDEDTGDGILSETPSGPTSYLGKGTVASIHVPTQNVIVDYLAPGRDIDRARFVAIKYKKDLAELKADPRYKKSALAKIPIDNIQSVSNTGNYSDRLDEMAEAVKALPSQRQPNTKLVDIYEVWVYQMVDFKLYKQLVVLMEGVDEPIREILKWEDIVGKGFPGWPIHCLTFNDVPDTYPIADIEAWHQLQLSLNWLTSKLCSFVSNDNYLVAADMSRIKDPDKFKKDFYAGGSKTLVEVKDGDPSTAIAPVSKQGANQDLYRLIDILNSFIMRVSGLGENRQGTAGSRTATEASIIESGQQIRTEEKVDVVRDFLLEDISKMVVTLQNTMTVGDAVRMAGKAGSIQWGRFEHEDLVGPPEVRIRVNSYRNQDTPEEIARWSNLWNLILQGLPVLGPAVKPLEIMRYLLKAYKVPNPDLIIGDSGAAREQQLVEIMLMMMGTDVAASPDEPHPDHINAIDMFVNTPIFNSLPGQVQAAILNHRAEHTGFMEQLASMAGGAGITPRGDSGGGQGQNFVATPANIARQETAYTREAIAPSNEGTGGQL